VRGAVIDGHRRQAYLETQHTSIDEWFEEDNGQQGGETESGNYIARYLCDRAPLPDELTNRAQLDRLAAAAIARLPDEERDVIRAALAGAAIGRIGQTRGHSPAWVRAKLAAARDKVAAAVQGKAA
jgi:DNA-directed RNA polymerase specialized sigma24 family protein